MVKSEENIIFESLVWHFCIGFRKFVIIDNGSTDGTRNLIERFRRRVKDHAFVVVIDYPDNSEGISVRQSNLLTSGGLLAHTMWKDVQWVFPLDADEFLWPRFVDLHQILSYLPPCINVLTFHWLNHFPTKTHEHYDFNKPFYENLTFRTKKMLWNIPGQPGPFKVAFKAGIFPKIQSSNHFVRSSEKQYYKATSPLGLDMRHFQRRSVEQIRSKQAKFNGQTTHSLQQSAEEIFDETVFPESECVQDPLPMKKAFELFDRLVGKEEVKDPEDLSTTNKAVSKEKK
jgi:hypothetical protein